MSTVLLPPPEQVRVAGPKGPARRAVVRWAWRMFRREWRQQLLVLALLAVAVAATILAAAIGTNTPPPRNAGFGTADHLVTLPAGDTNAAADIAAIGQRFGGVDVIENRAIATGMVQGAELRAQDPGGRYGSPMLAVVSGRYPTGPGEVAMTSGLMSTLDVHMGQTWQESGRALRVVGIVQNPQNLLDNFALVAPGQLGAADQVTVLFDATPASLVGFAFPGGVAPQTPQVPQGFDPAVVVLIFAIFGLIFVGLVTVAGFSVLAQRRMRGLGMLSSLGATDRHVRLVMVANGAVVGIVATLIGTVTGLAAWIAYAPHLQSSSHHRVVWTSLPWWLVVTTMVLAVLTSVLAARRPARAAARVSVVAALSGRPAPPRPVHRSAIPGLVLLATATVLLAFSGGWGSQTARQQAFQLGGVLGTAVGVLLLAPACITVLGIVAPRTPVAVRLALRDLARYRSRSGPALAAVSFAVLIAVLTTLLATARYADPIDYFGPNLPANQLVLYPPSQGPGGGPGPKTADPGTASPQQSAAEQEAVAEAIGASLGSDNVVALDTTEATLMKVVGQAALHYPGTVYVASPALLRHYGIDPGTIDPAAMLLTSRSGLEGTADLQLLSRGPDHGCVPGSCVPNPKIQTIHRLPTEASAPNLLVTEHAVETLNLQVAPAGWLIQATAPLNATQINTARQAAAAANMTIETKSQAPSLAQLRNYATAAGILLALGVLAMTIGLIRSETAADLRTLTATGASGRTRRGITAATAGALGLLGALLGTTVAYVATIALFRSQISERLGDVPVLDLALVVVGLPVIAMVGSWLLAGREPPAIAHQPIE